MQISDFDFFLPQTLIASKPLANRSASKLMCLSNSDTIYHRHFYNILDLISPGDLLIFNDSKVIPARLYGFKTTGGKVEVLIERILDENRALAQLRVSKPPHIGDELLFANNIRLLVQKHHQPFYELFYPGNIFDVIETIGEVPLPHYMQRSPDELDKSRYQTVYAKNKGSVAAPTAGFHFDELLLQQLRAKKVEMAYLTLHIGAGTFAPIRATNIALHQMHAEYFAISAEVCQQIKTTKANGKRVIAVGTTSMRALETASQTGEIMPYQGDTQIFIYEGFKFQCADVLITNFHLPRSTLLMLVCAFAGRSSVLSAYREAVEQSYRFYSYGDAMWVTKAS